MSTAAETLATRPTRRCWRVAALGIAGVMIAGGCGVAGHEASPPTKALKNAAPVATDAVPTTSAAAPEPMTPVVPAPAAAVASPSTASDGAPPPALPLAGCPPPPYHPPPSNGKPWRPSVLVPESALPAVLPPAALASDMAALRGKGMWIWQFKRTEGGDPVAVVRRAQAAGLHQLWVRVGDSQDGFYAASYLDQLVPAAHAAGMAVIGWGFPYLWDPVGDAGWTSQAYQWRSAAGDQLDGFSADIETAAEGTALSTTRVGVYLSQVRSAAPGRVLVATVYRPTDYRWATYPYSTMAPYVDAFAPMIYWGCDQPAPEAIQAIARLATLRPVHVIGQAYNMASEGGRTAAPSGAEIAQFLAVAWSRGAVGASFWDWQEINTDEWLALDRFGWLIPVRHVR